MKNCMKTYINMLFLSSSFLFTCGIEAGRDDMNQPSENIVKRNGKRVTRTYVPDSLPEQLLQLVREEELPHHAEPINKSGEAFKYEYSAKVPMQ